MSSKIKQTAIWAIGFVVAFFFVKGIKSYYFEEVTLKNIQIEAEESLEKLNNPTIKEGESKSEAVVNTAITNAQDSLANATSDSVKLRKAIDMFRGFYLVNVKARPKFCLQHNTRIDSFVRAFEKEHVKEYAYMKNYESSKEPLPASVYKMLEDLLDKQVATEMNNTAKEYGLTVEAFCQTIETNATDYVEIMKISVRMPEIHKLLNN